MMTKAINFNDKSLSILCSKPLYLSPPTPLPFSKKMNLSMICTLINTWASLGLDLEGKYISSQYIYLFILLDIRFYYYYMFTLLLFINVARHLLSVV